MKSAIVIVTHGSRLCLRLSGGSKNLREVFSRCKIKPCKVCDYREEKINLLSTKLEGVADPRRAPHLHGPCCSAGLQEELDQYLVKNE